jgi:hypothetical protein
MCPENEQVSSPDIACSYLALIAQHSFTADTVQTSRYQPLRNRVLEHNYMIIGRLLQSVQFLDSQLSYCYFK